MRISWDGVYERNIIEFLNVLSYIKSKAELEKWQISEMKKKLRRNG